MSTPEAPEAAPAVARRRPPGVVALAVVVGLQGLLLAAAGAVLVAARDDAEVQADLEAGAASVGATGAAVAVVGVVSVAVAVGLLRRSALARSVCTVVAVVQATTSVYALVALHDLRGSTVWSFAWAVGVLWFLYGSERTQAYFAR